MEVISEDFNTVTVESYTDPIHCLQLPIDISFQSPQEIQTKFTN